MLGIEPLFFNSKRLNFLGVLIVALVGSGLLAILTPSAQAANCQFQGEPVEPSSVRLQQIMAGFNRPVGIKFIPGYSDRYYVVEQSGLLKLVIGNQVQTTPALDLRSAISASGNETGFLGLAFHPQFVTNRRIFINYTTNGRLKTHISEFSVNANGIVDASSERLLLAILQPFSNHNGGDLQFGPDGYLYIGTGDGGSADDPQGNGQNLRVLLAKMLRIDVDHGDPYAIPSDNPTFADPLARREIFAYGLRNPWRYSFDRVTGELWVGDVGQNAYEEIDIVKNGGNYGWRITEGNHCRGGGTRCTMTNLAPAVYEYPRSEGASITGGYVYRGRAMPDFVGAYFYADYVSGNLWALRYDGTQVSSNKKLLESGLGISSFAEDHDGELYVLDHTAGRIYKIVGSSPTTTVDQFPRRISTTGCFSSLVPLRPAAGVIPFDVRAPLWSDGAAKERFIYLPNAMAVDYSSSMPWVFPNDTVLIKNFLLPRRDGRGVLVQKLIETRFLVKRPMGFKGYTYRWNDAGTDGDLLTGAIFVPETLSTASQDEHFNYYFPSSSDCQRCHNSSTAGALGFDLLHLNYGVASPTGQQNQILSLVGQQVFSRTSAPQTADEVEQLPALVDPLDSTQTLTSRARSYLHTQCAHCHNPDNQAQQGELDLRFATGFAAMHVCNEDPTQGDLGVEQAKLLKPGDPEHSLLWVRLGTAHAEKRMPPLATSRIDQAGADLIKAWIMGVRACP